ncbi:MAG TPA: MBL fold metallo-hydrolase, partial [Limnochordia bacterium]|nr:MBL fold metallo-hydrolase [Limnochordia bacterium]
MRLTFLGTASGLPAPTRFGQTIVLTVDEAASPPRHILLDPGDGASSLLARGGFDHTHIAAIFISHMHADHHGGFAQVVKTSMHLGKRSPLVVYAPAEGIAALQAYLDASYLFAPWLGFELVWVPLSSCLQQETSLVDGVRMQLMANAHLRSWRARVAGLAQPPRTCSFESYS